MAKRVVLELGSSTNFVYSLKDAALCRILFTRYSPIACFRA